jgi:hypothetical protein
MDFNDNNNLQLLDIIGTSKNNLLFSSLDDYLIYSIGSNIIFHNLRKNTKTFLQNYYKTDISTYKFIDIKETEEAKRRAYTSFGKLILSDENNNPIWS